MISCINNNFGYGFGLNYAESIYVRVYEDRIDLIRAAIVGPAGTPYHDGLFFFDVHFPPEYPRCPPVCYYFTLPLPLIFTISHLSSEMQYGNENLLNMHRKFITIRVGFG